ncbi:MAG: chromosome partitioning protein ParB [Gammaproteobacteria bacterium]|nr:chromosome partitioning protein ParB [Gammaproteobacteria bacterium]MYF58653.1 chromosome partitioning protein ParB [Gammaproteobacteria bacterium]
MNPTASPPGAVIRDIPLSRLFLAPENVRKTPAHDRAQAELEASIRAHGLLENLVARADGTDDDGNERFAVLAGGRRLAALQSLAGDGALDPELPVLCRIAPDANGGELSLAENVVRIAMHPADQVAAFSALAGDGLSVAAIANRFGVSERIVEQRLRLGNAAPELLDAYREEAIDLETLKAFAVTPDTGRQLAVWEQVSAQDYRPTAWQVKRLMTEERVPGSSALARFVSVDAYEAAGGPVMRDLFADGHENGTWFEDPALLNDLAMKKLEAVADELSTRWKWAEARLEVDWSTAARYGRVHPRPGEPTDEETAETERLRTRHDELANLDDEDWTEALEAEAESIDERLDAIEQAVEARARFRREDFAIAGAIATVGRDGTLQIVQGLVKPKDMPKADPAAAGANGHAADTTAGNGTAGAGSVDAPAVSAPLAPPPDPRATARQEAGVGIGLADDLRAIRTALVKAHLATDFEAAFDLTVFQMVRAVFAHGYTTAYHALDIAFKETADRPAMRMNDDGFAASSPGEAMLADWSDLPFDWIEADDDAACFDALRNLPRADKEKLFAAAVARTVRGQLAFEHEARPELEATVARLGIEFAKHVRPTADLVWSRLRKDRILAIARDTLGPAWASARSKYKKVDLAKAMEEAFAAGKPPVGIGADEHAAALAWTPPGFAAFDAGGDAEAEPAPDGKDDAPAQAEHATGGNGHAASARERNDVPASGNGAGDVGHSAADAGVTDANGETAGEAADVPEFLRQATQTQ